MAERNAAIIGASLGLMMAASSPAAIAIVKNVDEISGLDGRPKDMLLTPRTVLTPSLLFDQPDRPHGLERPFLLCADRKRQTVDNDIGTTHAQPPRQSI